jgi:hypothetical protein
MSGRFEYEEEVTKYSMSMVMEFCMWKKVWSEWSMAGRGVSTKPG